MNPTLGPSPVRGRPLLPEPVEAATASVFYGLTRLRGPRAFHPYGGAFTCTLTIGDGRPLGVRDGARFSGVCRLSRSAGLPAPLPDARGIGLRLIDFPAAGQEQDLLFVTSGSYRVLRHAIVPTTGFLQRFYSTLLPYHLGGWRVILGLRPQPADVADQTLEDLRGAVAVGLAGFTLVAAGPWGPWRDLGVLTLDAALPDRDQQRLAFNPFNATDVLRPAGFVNALRDAAYRGSQAAR